MVLSNHVSITLDFICAFNFLIDFLFKPFYKFNPGRLYNFILLSHLNGYCHFFFNLCLCDLVAMYTYSVSKVT